MDNQLFRQKSLERISSPEALHDYMRVTSPRLWMILGAILLLLGGFIAYASTATMENVLPVQIQVLNMNDVPAPEGEGTVTLSTIYFNLPVSYQGVVKTGMTVRVGNHRGQTDLITQYSEENEELMMVLVNMEDDTFHLPDGTYDGELVLESMSPISFLWN